MYLTHIEAEFETMVSFFPVSIENCRLALNGLITEPGAAEQTKNFRDKGFKLFESLDQKMTRLLIDDSILLTSWANWMRSCLEAFDTLDKNIPFIGKRQWSWEEVLDAMALLEGIRTDVESFLLKQRVDPDAE